MTKATITRIIGESPTIDLPAIATYGWLVERCEELNRIEPQDEDFRDEKLDFLEGVIASLPDNLTDDHPIRFYNEAGDTISSEELGEYESLFVGSAYERTRWEYGHERWTGDCIWATPTPERYADWRKECLQR